MERRKQKKRLSADGRRLTQIAEIWLREAMLLTADGRIPRMGKGQDIEKRRITRMLNRSEQRKRRENKGEGRAWQEATKCPFARDSRRALARAAATKKGLATKEHRDHKRKNTSSRVCGLYVPWWQGFCWNCAIPRYCTTERAEKSALRKWVKLMEGWGLRSFREVRSADGRGLTQTVDGKQKREDSFDSPDIVGMRCGYPRQAQMQEEAGPRKCAEGAKRD